MWLEVAKVVMVMWKAEDGRSALTEPGTQQVLLKFIAITIVYSFYPYFWIRCWVPRTQAGIRHRNFHSFGAQSLGETDDKPDE